MGAWGFRGLWGVWGLRFRALGGFGGGGGGGGVGGFRFRALGSWIEAVRFSIGMGLLGVSWVVINGRYKSPNIGAGYSYSYPT